MKVLFIATNLTMSSVIANDGRRPFIGLIQVFSVSASTAVMNTATRMYKLIPMTMRFIDLTRTR